MRSITARRVVQTIIVIAGVRITESAGAPPATGPASRPIAEAGRQTTLCDLYNQIADDQLALIGEVGIAATLSEGEQKRLDERVRVATAEADAFYRGARAEKGPPDPIALEMNIIEAGDDLPARLARTLRHEPTAFAAAFDAASARAEHIVPVAIIDPGLIRDWLSTAKVPADAADRVRAACDRGAARVVVAAKHLPAGPGHEQEVIAYRREVAASRHDIWASVAGHLTSDQRIRLAAAMDGDDRQFRAAVRFNNWAGRGFVPTDVPVGAVADSDRLNGVEQVSADATYALVRADDGTRIAVLRVAKGGPLGFAFFHMADRDWLVAVAGSKRVDFEPDQHVYYWVPVAAGTAEQAPPEIVHRFGGADGPIWPTTKP